MRFKRKNSVLRFLEYVVYSNVFVSFSAAFLCYGFCVLFQLSIAFELAVFLWFSTQFIYTTQRLIKAKDAPRTSLYLLWIKYHRRFLRGVTVFSGFITLGLGLTYFVSNWRVGLLLIGSFVISIWYVFPLLKTRLREIPYLKIHLIAFTWVLACGIFPLLLNENWNLDFWSFVGLHYFLLLAVCIPFDIRDLKIDSPKQKTIPQTMGINGSKVVSVLSFIVFYSSITQFEFVKWNFPLVLSLCLSFVLLLFTTKKRKLFFYAIGWEAVLILVGLSYIIQTQS
jgi:hypothetical protein